MALGNAYEARCTVPDATEVTGVWTGGGAAADCTHTSTDWSKGIASIAYAGATGKYTITFTDVGQQLIGWTATVLRATTEDPMFFLPIAGTLSTSAKTLSVECNVGGTLTDALTTDKILINAKFAKQKP